MALHKLPESELKVMDFVWSQGETTAKATAAYMEEAFGWKKNTTYTVLKNLGIKGFIERIDPGFKCVPLVSRESVGRAEWLSGRRERLLVGKRPGVTGAGTL